MSIAMAFVPSNSRSRWRSRKASLPRWTRSPSHTPSPSMKPLSKTETTASLRGLSSPFTLIRIDAFRGSETSCIDFAMSVRPEIGSALQRANEQPAQVRPASAGPLLDVAHDLLDLRGGDRVVEIDVDHGRDHVGRGMDGEDVAYADDSVAGEGERPQLLDEIRVRRLSDQQALRLISEQGCRYPENHADQDRCGAVVEGIAGHLREQEPERGSDDSRDCGAVLEEHNEGRWILR